MNQSGQRWNKYRLLPPGDVWWWWWWKKLHHSEPVEIVTQSQTAIRKKAGDRKKARPPRRMNVTLHLYSDNAFALQPYFTGLTHSKPRRMALHAKKKKKLPSKNIIAQSKVRLNESLLLLSSLPCIWITDTQILLVLFCLFEQLFESIEDVLMMNIEVSAASLAQTLLKYILEDCGKRKGVKCYDGGQIWYSDCSKSLTNRGRSSMTMKLNFDLFDVSLSWLCSRVTHIDSSDLPTVATNQKVGMETDSNFSPFYRSVDPTSKQIFLPWIHFCFKSCRDITLSEFALDLPAYTCFHTKASIFNTELLTCESKWSIDTSQNKKAW